MIVLQLTTLKLFFVFHISAECKEFMVRYMRCLRDNSQQHAECRQQAKDYLQCRMDK